MYNLTLGQYLDSARRNAGLSVTALAELTGIPRSKMYELIGNQRQQPRVADLLALARALEVPTTELFEHAGIPMPPEAVSVEAFLRTAYELPPDAVAEAKASIEEIVARYRDEATTNEGRNP